MDKEELVVDKLVVDKQEPMDAAHVVAQTRFAAHRLARDPPCPTF